jgi:hypothetical protein
MNGYLSQEELGGTLLGHPIDLMAKAGGERSMSEKQGSLEDAEGAVLQDPRDRVKSWIA